MQESKVKITNQNSKIKAITTKKVFLFIFISCVTFWFRIYKIHASEVVFEEYTSYTFKSDTTCQVQYTISAINQSADYFPTIFELKTSLKDINNVLAKKTNGQILTTEIYKENENYVIKVFLENSSLGKNSKTDFYITFSTREFMSKYGLINEISIPAFTQSEDTILKKMDISIPQSFGKPKRIYPKEFYVTEKNDSLEYSFDEKSINGKPAVLTFGDHQLYSFEIIYNLSNEGSVFSKTFEVPIPPDIINTQQIYILNIVPNPTTTNMDENSNFIAKYVVPPKSKVGVKISGAIKTYKNETNIIVPTDNITKGYLQNEKYWDSASQEIKDLSTNLTNKKNSVIDNAKNIYDFVTSTLKYSNTRLNETYVERYGSLKALQEKGNAVCMEFTDLTIALLRAAGIPAREINGYAYTNNKTTMPLSVFYGNATESLHSWVEFYDPKIGWIQIDPTWGATSKIDYFSNMDLNHVVFVRKSNPEYPLPPGVYKSTENSININFATEDIIEKVKTPYIKIKKIFAGINIVNEGPISIYNLKSPNGSVYAQILPPGSSKNIYGLNAKIQYEDSEKNVYQIDSKEGLSIYLATALVLCMSVCGLLFLLKGLRK